MAGRLRRRLALAFSFGANCLEASHVSLLDGHTLNVCVPLPEDSAKATLVLVDGKTTLRLPTTIARGGDSPPRAQSTVVLRNGPHDETFGYADLAVREGIWSLGVELPANTGQGITRPISVNTVTDGTSGPTLARPTSGHGGLSIKLSTRPGAGVTLGVTNLAAFAEVSHVDLSWLGFSVEGELLGAWDVGAPTTSLVLKCGEGGRSVSVPLSVDGTRFSFSVPFTELVETPGPRVWDCFVTQGRITKQVGRQLADIKDVRGVYSSPVRVVSTESGGLVRARAYYTKGRNLRISCLPMEAGISV